MKAVLITGASGGIGAAAVKKFAHEGWRVFAHYNTNEEAATALQKEYGAIPLQADLTDPDAVSALFEKVGALDALVTCAGAASQKLFTDVTVEEFHKLMDANFTSAFLCCQAASRGMISAHKGKIVTVSSIWGMTGASCEVVYSAAKSAVIGMTKALAKELGPSGICVNCVAPGVIDTPMNAHLSPDTMRSLSDDTPLCRIGTPDEAASAIYFLASAEADFITGQVISPNGGFVI